MTADRTLIVAASAWGFLLLLSLLLFLFLPGKLVRTVLRFPDSISRQLSAEVRALPFTWETEHNIELMVREVLLGPAQYSHLRLFSREAQLRSVLVRGDTLYMDLSKEAFLPDPDVVYSPQMALDVLRSTLMDNFPGVSHVFISVGGEPEQGKSR